MNHAGMDQFEVIPVTLLRDDPRTSDVTSQENGKISGPLGMRDHALRVGLPAHPRLVEYSLQVGSWIDRQGFHRRPRRPAFGF